MFEAPPIPSTENSDLNERLLKAVQHQPAPVQRDAVRLGLITQQKTSLLQQPQLLVFAADHGIAASAAMASPTNWRGPSSAAQVTQWLSPGNLLAEMAQSQGFGITFVDAGLAEDLPKHPQLLQRKISYGTRDTCLAPAMSESQAVAALNAGLEIANLLPGELLALTSIGVGQDISGILLAARLADQRLERMGAQSGLHVSPSLLARANLRHAYAVSPFHALCAFGGYEIGMLCGAMLQAAMERRVILASGLACATAALLAKQMAPHVDDYIFWAGEADNPNEQSVLQHLNVQVLPLRSPSIAPGSQALMAWPWLLAASRAGEKVAVEPNQETNAPATLNRPSVDEAEDPHREPQRTDPIPL